MKLLIFQMCVPPTFLEGPSPDREYEKSSRSVRNNQKSPKAGAPKRTPRTPREPHQQYKKGQKRLGAPYEIHQTTPCEHTYYNFQPRPQWPKPGGAVEGVLRALPCPHRCWDVPVTHDDMETRLSYWAEVALIFHLNILSGWIDGKKWNEGHMGPPYNLRCNNAPIVASFPLFPLSKYISYTIRFQCKIRFLTGSWCFHSVFIAQLLEDWIDVVFVNSINS